MLERIQSERLVIRCWRPEDAAPLKDAIDSSLGQLRRVRSRGRWTNRRSVQDACRAARRDARSLRCRSRLGVCGCSSPASRDSLAAQACILAAPLTTSRSATGSALTQAAEATPPKPRPRCVTPRSRTQPSSASRSHCDVENARSAAVAQRLGFARGREFRQEALTLRRRTRRHRRVDAVPKTYKSWRAFARKKRVGSTI